jgi:bifunctional DNA-binding transcriptional regulator/antitoxin component of YhaV-PrlF toxin-antitoxin module
MTVVVKSKDDLVVPRSVRRRAGIKSRDRVEFKVSGGIINIIPELPTANGEYTPAQRRLLDAVWPKPAKARIMGPLKQPTKQSPFSAKRSETGEELHARLALLFHDHGRFLPH